MLVVPNVCIILKVENNRVHIQKISLKVCCLFRIFSYICSQQLNALSLLLKALTIITYYEK